MLNKWEAYSMKKKLAFALSIILCFGSAPLNVMAAESTKEVYERVIDLVEKQQDEYGGIYFKNGVLHVLPTEYSHIPMDLLSSIEGTEVVIDAPVRYSMAELENAFLCLRENSDTLNVTAYAISVRNNGISVYATVWTEEEKDKIRDLIDVENIKFVTEGLVDYSEPESKISVPQQENYKINNETKALAPRAKIGYALNLGQTTTTYTLGRSVEDWDGNIFFQTAAHGLKVGDIINVAATVDSDTGNYVVGELGRVSDLKMRGNMDVALIKSTGKFRPTGVTNTNVVFGGDSVPYEGFNGIVWTKDGPVKMEITEAKIDIDWNDPTYGDVQKYTDLFQMGYTTSTVTGGGDSGAGVSIIWEEDNEQSYVGIYKGRRILSDGTVQGFGSSRQYIDAYFDTTSVHEP